MELTVDDLRYAKLENIERLARFMKVKLPSPTLRRDVYQSRLVRAVALQIRRDAQQDRAEAFERAHPSRRASMFSAWF
jgi:hypothetical protein